MTKLLTLNTHSWMEANALKKLVDLAEHILAEKYDIICLQEINQLIESELAMELPSYQPIPGTPTIHKDHFALLLIHYLKSGDSTIIGLGLTTILAMTFTMKAWQSYQNNLFMFQIFSCRRWMMKQTTILDARSLPKPS